jgi:hypothetical protein
LTHLLPRPEEASEETEEAVEVAEEASAEAEEEAVEASATQWPELKNQELCYKAQATMSLTSKTNITRRK